MPSNSLKFVPNGIVSVLAPLKFVATNVSAQFVPRTDSTVVSVSVPMAVGPATIALDAKALDALCTAELSYGHSDARVEDKATFIKNATTNRNAKTLSLAYQDPKIKIVGPAAIARFNWASESEAIADGKKSTTKLHVLMNWQKQGADWKLSLARQLSCNLLATPCPLWVISRHSGIELRCLLYPQ